MGRNKINIIKAQLKVDRQPQQAVGKPVAIGQTTSVMSLGIVRTFMETLVMKDRHNPIVLQVTNQPRSFFCISTNQIEHMGIICGITRDLGKFKVFLQSQVAKVYII